MSHGTARQAAGSDSLSLHWHSAPDDPPAPDPASSSLQFGMDEAAVTRLFGPPNEVQIRGDMDAYDWVARYVDDGLESVEVLEKWQLPRIAARYSAMAFFAPGSAELTPEAEAAIAKAVAWFEGGGGTGNIDLLAHTDTAEGATGPADLSSRRGEAVRRRLIALGVPEARIELRTFGSTAQLVPTPPDTPEAQNRRVEIIWLPKLTR